MKNLSELTPGNTAFIVNISGKGEFRRHLIDMGITPGTKVRIVRFAPLGDPIQINIRGYELSIRKSEAEKILISYEQIPEIDWEVVNNNESTKK